MHDLSQGLYEKYEALIEDEENRREFARWHDLHPDAAERSIKAKITRMKDHPVWRRALDDISKRYPDDSVASVLSTCVYNMENYRPKLDPGTQEQIIPAESDPSIVAGPPAGGHVEFPYGFEAFARGYLRKPREPKEKEMEKEKEPERTDNSCRDQILLYVLTGAKGRGEIEEKLKEKGYEQNEINRNLEEFEKAGVIHAPAMDSVDPASVGSPEKETAGGAGKDAEPGMEEDSFRDDGSSASIEPDPAEDRIPDIPPGFEEQFADAEMEDALRPEDAPDASETADDRRKGSAQGIPAAAVESGSETKASDGKTEEKRETDTPESRVNPIPEKAAVENAPYEVTTDRNGRQVITIHSGCSMADLRGLEVKDGATLKLEAGVKPDGKFYTNNDKGTVVVTAEMLAYFGPKVNKLVIGKGTRVDVAAYGDGDVWGKNLPNVNFLEIRNNEGVASPNGKGMFEGYRKSLSVAIVSDGEVTLGDNFCAGAKNLVSLLHYSEDGLDHGLTVGHNFAFGKTPSTSVRGLDGKSYRQLYGEEMTDRDLPVTGEESEFVREHITAMRNANEKLIGRAKEDVVKAKTDLAAFVKANGLDELFGAQGSAARRFLSSDADDLRGEDLRIAAKDVRDNAARILEGRTDGLQEEFRRKLKSVIQCCGSVNVLEKRSEGYDRQIKEIDGKSWNGTYVSLGASINAGESFLGMRAVDIRSSKDPDCNAAKRQIWNAVRDKRNAFNAIARYVNAEVWSNPGLAIDSDLSGEKKEAFRECLTEYQKWIAGFKNEKIENRMAVEVSDAEIQDILKTDNDRIRKWQEKSPEFVSRIFSSDFPEALTSDGKLQDFDEMEKMLANSANTFVLSPGSKLGDHSLSYGNIEGFAIEDSSGQFRQFKAGAERLLDAEIADFNGRANGLDLPDIRDFKGNLNDFQRILTQKEDAILKAIAEPPSKEKDGKENASDVRKSEEKRLSENEDRVAQLNQIKYLKGEGLQKIGFLVNLNEQCATEEIWMQNRGYALKSARNALEKFKQAHANNKTKDFTTRQDVYDFVYEQANDKEKAEYDRLVAEVKNLEKDPRKVHLGDNCLSHLKGNGVTFYNVSEKTCDAMGLGCGNQGGTRSIGPDSLGNTSPWTQMSDGVVSSGWFRDSDIVRGKVRCSAENFRDWLKACRKQPFRIMRLSEALVDFAANLLELLFNLMVLAKNEVFPLVNRGVVKATESRAQSLEDRKQANEELLMTVRKDGKIDVSKIPEGVEMKVRRYIMKLRPEEGLDGKKLEKLQDYLEKKSGALTRKQNVNAFIGDNAKAKMDARLQAGVDKKDMHREAGKKGRSQKEIRDARAKANTREG